VPLFFSGFWSKDEILHSASAWSVSRWPFYLLSIATILTAFYMTRQMCYVFYGDYRGTAHPPKPFESPIAVDEHSLSPGERGNGASELASGSDSHQPSTPHESPPIMTWPLIILAACSILVGFVGTPLWPWFHSFIEGQHVHSGSLSTEVLGVMLLSILLVAAGIGAGWWLYGRKRIESAEQPDVIQVWNADFFALLRQHFLVDELYDASVVVSHRCMARISDVFDRFVWGGVVRAVSYLVIGLSWIDRLIDEFLINLGFNQGSETVRRSARYLSLFQNGQVQRYLRVLAVSISVLAFFFLWGCRA
jgi:NADH-quinone oxidoreductase subunit L